MRNKAKILSFYQNSDFYIRTGDKKADKNDWISALSRYRKAYEKDITNHEACMAYAEMLNHLQFYEESNRLILRQISMTEPVSDYLFGIACNFYGIYEFERAKECLLSYLSIDPDGLYAYQASDFLDVLDDKDELSDELDVNDYESIESIELCIKAKNYIRSSNTNKAKEILTLLVNSFSSNRAKLLMASIYLDEGLYKKAETIADEVLLLDSDSVFAKCIKAFICKLNGDKNKSKAILDEIDCSEVYEVEYLQNIAMQYIELKYYETAKNILKYALQISPYNRQSLHLFAIANCCMNDFKEAIKCYELLLKIDSNNIIASYYLSECVENHHKFNLNNWSLEYKLPPVITLINISDLLNTLDNTEYARQKWNNDVSFGNMVEWALTTDNDKAINQSIAFLRSVNDLKSEMILRDYILKIDRDDKSKEKAMIALKCMGAKTPYMSYFDGEWIESRINAFKTDRDVSQVCSQIIGLVIMHTQDYLDQESFIECCSGILFDYYNKTKREGKRILRSQIPVYAAGINILACEKNSIEYSIEDICNNYDISNIRLSNIMKKLKEYDLECNI